MTNERTKSVATQAMGSLKDAIGKVTGNATAEAEGKAQMAAGKAQEAAASTDSKTNKILDGDK